MSVVAIYILELQGVLVPLVLHTDIKQSACAENYKVTRQD
jgi:hypothetical protein